MIPKPDFILFLTTVIVASIIPGPSMLLGAIQGHHQGAHRSITTAFGHILMTALQASLSLLGVGIFLQNAPQLLQLLQIVGIIYLVYLGMRFFITNGDQTYIEKMGLDSNKSRFATGFWVTASNPKAILFFGAIFPQFLNIDRPLFSQIIIMISTVCTVTFSCFMLYAISGEKIIRVVTNRYSQENVNRFFGSLFILIATLVLFNL